MMDPRVASLEAMKASYTTLGHAIDCMEAAIRAEILEPPQSNTGWDAYPATLSVSEAAEAAGVAIMTLRKWLLEPDFPAAKRGERWLIDRDRFRQWLYCNPLSSTVLQLAKRV